MQRLTGLSARLPRRTDERGAVVVMVAFLMTAIVGFAAVSIDLAAMWSQRQRLQTGADAGAMAIAQDCARNSCGTPSQTADEFAIANFGGGTAAGTVTADVLTGSLSPSSGQVTVRTSAISRHLFAPIFGRDSDAVSARATARWGAPIGGTAVLPLTFSWCEWMAQTGGGQPTTTTERIIFFTKGSGVTGCTGPSNLAVPGGFGWVDPDAGSCQLTSSVSQTLISSTGNATPSGCSAADWQAQLNRIVLLPLFDQAGGTGSNATYHVYGYAAFKLTGYRFPATSWNDSGCASPSRNCLKGYFTQFVDLDDAFAYGPSAPQLGATVVKLTQ